MYSNLKFNVYEEDYEQICIGFHYFREGLRTLMYLHYIPRTNYLRWPTFHWTIPFLIDLYRVSGWKVSKIKNLYLGN
jgi:hypothetical protein